MQIALRTYTLLLVLVAGTGCVTATALASTGGTAGGSTPPATPSSPATNFRTTAIATWFGPGFYGKQTACGQKLTPEVVGVANRKLPCGTLVRVSYRGHSLTVPVLDRGPYSHNAQWDLTAGAAQHLGITETVRVSTHIVGRTANTPSLGLPPGGSPSPSGEDASATLAGGATAG